MWWIAVDDRPRGRVPARSQNQGCMQGCFNLGCTAVFSIILLGLGVLALGFLLALIG